MKRILVGIYFLLVSISYSDTHWSGNYHNENLVILYKVLDPLIVTIDAPQKIILPAVKGTYRYSEKSKSQRPLRVVVKADYTKSQVDNILRKVYEKVYFRLQGNGDFDLVNRDEMSKKIQGKGYFIDSESGATVNNKLSEINKSFAGSVGAEKFSAETEIDADFIINDPANVPMGLYTGTLKLDVWFQGTI